MIRFFLISAIALLTASCSTTGKIHPLRVSEMDHVIGQWDYELIDSEGTKARGFFQIDPANREHLSVTGQSYLDKGVNELKIANLRGLWTGAMKHGDEPHQYVLTFSIKENPIFPERVGDDPLEGTVLFNRRDNVMSGSFKFHVPKDGPTGTMVAHKRK